MKLTTEMMRLYAVTDHSRLRGQTLYDQVEQALVGGATLVQLREKELDEDAFMREAVDMAGLCHRYGVPLLINDNVDVARRSGADGVHVGQDDMEAASARSILRLFCQSRAYVNCWRRRPSTAATTSVSCSRSSCRCPRRLSPSCACTSVWRTGTITSPDWSM